MIADFDFQKNTAVFIAISSTPRVDLRREREIVSDPAARPDIGPH